MAEAPRGGQAGGGQPGGGQPGDGQPGDGQPGDGQPGGQPGGGQPHGRRARAGAIAFNLVGLLLVLAAAPLSWAALDSTRPAATASAAPIDVPASPAASAAASAAPSAAASAAPTLAYGAGTWTKLAPLDRGLWGAAGVTMPDGRVLVVGGAAGNSSRRAVASAKLIDPATGGWTPQSEMAQSRAYPMAVLLGDGTVLVAGGSSNGAPLNSAERFFPSDGRSGTWRSAGQMTTPRTHGTATLLADGRVLVAGGGTVGAPDYTATASAEIYDPATNGWTEVPDMSRPRALHIAAILPSGEVLVAGGADVYKGQGEVTATAEIYSPKSNTWRQATPMGEARYSFAAAPLRDGRVLVAGGWSYTTDTDPSLATAEAYDAQKNRWDTEGSMRTGRAQFSLATLADGRVLAVAGVSPSYGVMQSCDLYNVAKRAWSPTGDLPQALMWGVVAALADGRALAVGGAMATNASRQSSLVAVLAPLPPQP